MRRRAHRLKIAIYRDDTFITTTDGLSSSQKFLTLAQTEQPQRLTNILKYMLYARTRARAKNIEYIIARTHERAQAYRDLSG